jgi:hypothetical protein
MDLTLPLYRQLNGRFFLLTLCFFLCSIIGIGLYFYQAQQLAQLNTQQLPALSQHSQRQTVLINNERLINTIVASKNAAEFGQYYQEIDDNLQQLSTLSNKDRRLLKQLSQRHQTQAENVIRLTNNDRRNIQLKDSVIIQLTIVADSLSALTAKQSLQQSNLYQQVSSGRLNNSVTATRAKALSIIAIELNRNRELSRLVIDSLVMFSNIDLQYDPIEFNFLQQQTSLGIEKWLKNINNAANKGDEEKSLAEQVNVLNQLLFTEQNTFAKWRGQLRQADEFRTELLAQKNQLSSLMLQTLAIAAPKSSKLNQQLQLWFSKINISLSMESSIWLVIAIFSSTIIMFTIVLISVRTKLKILGKQSTAVIVEYVEEGDISTELPTREMSKILACVKQLSRPEHSESDYISLQQQQQSYALQVSQHSGHVFWQLPIMSLLECQALASVLDADVENRHWRHLFSRADVSTIISMARTAKTNKTIQRLSLITMQEKAISLTFEYSHKTWCGSICLTAEFQQLKDENSQLQQQMQEGKQAEKLRVIADSDYVIHCIQDVMLLNQLASIPRQNSTPIDDKVLQKLLHWSEQQRNSAQLRRDDYLLSLSTVNVMNELHTVASNVGYDEVKNNNFLYVKTDKKLNPQVTLESELFQTLLATVCTKLLAAQHDTTLDIDLKVVDINSAQQIVRCSFLVSTPSDSDKLSQAIYYLAQDDEISTDDSFNYLRDLMLVFSVSNKENLILEQGGKFAFDIPMTISEQTITKVTQSKSEEKLTKRSVLIIATDKDNRQRICQALNNTKAKIDTMRDLSLFTRQLSLKHLTAYRVDAIVISPEVYRSDFDLVVQHLATLPEKLQPKVMVIQPLYNTSFGRAGLFSQCNSPWYESVLANKLAQLLTNQGKNNLLINDDSFNGHHFLPTQVKVLLGVAQPSEYQPLMQILHWLGLRFTLVSQQQSLEKHWQSGQYLIVISEFLPFEIEIPAAMVCTRGVFSIDDNAKVPNEFLTSLTIPETWCKGSISTELDIQTIINLLQPWLKPANEQGGIIAKTEEIVQERAFDSVGVISAETVEIVETAEVSKAENDAKLDKTVSFSPDTLPENTEHGEFFDLAKFAKNQGSVELAALMLDEYLMDIKQQLLCLESAITDNDRADAQQCLVQVIHLAGVIAAEPLLAQSRECQEELAAIEQNKALSLLQSMPLQQQVKQLKLCSLQLTEFTQSI